MRRIGLINTETQQMNPASIFYFLFNWRLRDDTVICFVENILNISVESPSDECYRVMISQNQAITVANANS